MPFDQPYDEADGRTETRPETNVRRNAACDMGAEEAVEPRSHEEYYEALRAADDEESPNGDGDRPGAQNSDRTDAGHDDGEDKQADDAGTGAPEDSDSHGGSGSAWDGIDAEERPPVDAIRVSPERAKHILDGDDKGGGGHRHGIGKPGKTEFPADWDDMKVLDMVHDVARHPDRPPYLQENGRWRTRGMREDVEIVAIVERNAEVWSGWPLFGGPGVVKNPKET